MTLLVFIAILSVLVFVHELGHFLAAKRAGILVEEFGFGLPPRIWGKKVGETIYSLNALPIGGFVRLYGENGEEEKKAKSEKNKGRAFYEKSLWRRFSVLVAGVLMNLLLAITAFSILYYVYGIPSQTERVKIVSIAEGSPAQTAGLKTEDQLVAINGQKITSVDEFVKLSQEKAGDEIELEVLREENQKMVLSLTPRQDPPEGEGPLGVAISDIELRKYPWYQMPFLGAREGLKESLAWGGMIFQTLKTTAVNLATQGKVPKDIAGPVGIYQITGQAAKLGPLAVLQFMGILSVNLAIINILPLPALDGGRLIFLGYEVVTKKRPHPKVENWINTAGMAFLLLLMLLITVNDILRLTGK